MSDVGGPVVLALLMTRSPMIWGRFALSVFSVAALFLVKRTGGELGVNRSASLSGRWADLSEPRRLDSVEMLADDRGVPKLEEPWLDMSGMMVRDKDAHGNLGLEIWGKAS
jgi:hypothetical protein